MVLPAGVGGGCGCRSVGSPAAPYRSRRRTRYFPMAFGRQRARRKPMRLSRQPHRDQRTANEKAMSAQNAIVQPPSRPRARPCVPGMAACLTVGRVGSCTRIVGRSIQRRRPLLTVTVTNAQSAASRRAAGVCVTIRPRLTRVETLRTGPSRQFAFASSGNALVGVLPRREGTEHVPSRTRECELRRGRRPAGRTPDSGLARTDAPRLRAQPRTPLDETWPLRLWAGARTTIRCAAWIGSWLEAWYGR